MRLSDLGEFGLIAEIKEQFVNFSVPTDVEGIGDDCAVIPKDEKFSYVITTDMLVEGKHFLTNKISAFELGYKSLAVNISDVAAMGAAPKFSLLSLGVSKESDAEWCRDFIKGYHSLSAQYGVLLLGGDTTAAETGHMTISVTVLGEIENRNIKRRSSAQKGDIIAVSGHLGDSALALQLMMQGETPCNELLKKHNMPSAQVVEGIWFGAQEEVHAMMDISDGVSSDIEHICRLSSCGAKIYTNAIPYSDIFNKICSERHFDKLALSLSGGEDYVLLLTIDGAKFEEFKQRYSGIIYPLGEITDSGKVEYIGSDDQKIEQKRGFRHF